MKERIEKVLPKCMKSRTAKLEPKRADPNVASELPSRLKERKARDDPRCAMSKTAKELPKRARPKIDSVLPSRE
jgi:hypothetical protein